MAVRGVMRMGCVLKYLMWALIAVSCGVGVALLFPLSLIAGLEAILIVLLCLLIASKK